MQEFRSSRATDLPIATHDPERRAMHGSAFWMFAIDLSTTRHSRARPPHGVGTVCAYVRYWHVAMTKM